jgi:hypothetical protein
MIIQLLLKSNRDKFQGNCDNLSLITMSVPVLIMKYLVNADNSAKTNII